MTPEREPQKNPIDLSSLKTMSTVKEKFAKVEDLLNGANPEEKQDLVLDVLGQARQEYQRVEFHDKNRQVGEIMAALERGEVSPEDISQAIKPPQIQEEGSDGIWSKVKNLFARH